MLRLLFLSGAASDCVSFPGSFPVLVTGRNLRVLFQTWWLEFCNPLAWGMAEVMLRHSWLSILQLRKQAHKLSFRCCKVFLFSFFFFLYFFNFFWIMCDWMGGKHNAMYRSRNMLLNYICSSQVAGQIPGWHSLSWRTSVWGLHDRITLQEPNPPVFLIQGEEIQPHISSSFELLIIWWSWAQSSNMLSTPMGISSGQLMVCNASYDLVKFKTQKTLKTLLKNIFCCLGKDFCPFYKTRSWRSIS